MAVESHPASDTGAGLRPGLPCMQIDALIFQGASEALDEAVVQIVTFAVHLDADARSTQAICPDEGYELESLIVVYDVRRAEPIDRLVQDLDAEVGDHRVRDPPRQRRAGVSVHDGYQIEEHAAHRQLGDVHG